jgi:alkylation response protein AidB-like acyl-CoA dehydrogenase
MSSDTTIPRPTQTDEPRLLLTDEQTELRKMVRVFCDDRATESDVRRDMETVEGFDAHVWKQMGAELGICGLAVPEEYGGAGGSFADVAVVIEELGRSLACVPFLSSVVLAQSLLLAVGDETAMRRWLPSLCSGATRGTVAFAELDAPWDGSGTRLGATPADGGWRLTGSKTYVVDGHTSDVVFVVANAPKGLSVFAVHGDAAGLQRVALPTLDQTRKQALLDFAAVPAQLVGDEGTGERALSRTLDLAAVALSAESVGAAQHVLDLSVEYAKTRMQFGRAIGSFQAIKHKCADMLLKVESAKSAAYYARSVAARGDEAELSSAASLAKAFCQDAFAHCAAETIQIHGGIGFTWEHPAHLYFKRAVANQLMFGTSAAHRQRLADRIGI